MASGRRLTTGGSLRSASLLNIVLWLTIGPLLHNIALWLSMALGFNVTLLLKEMFKLIITYIK